MTYLEVDAVTKSFEGRLGRNDVLQGVSFQVERGDVTWISSPSGGGKSTLLNVLGLLSQCDGGSYRLEGLDLTRLPARRRTELRRTMFSTIFQSGNLFAHLTALENVLMGMPRGGGRRARAAL
ncbi:MAG: ATP-binding cassette domain-containing protein, partial [Actinomycetales bacterium]